MCWILDQKGLVTAWSLGSDAPLAQERRLRCYHLPRFFGVEQRCSSRRGLRMQKRDGVALLLLPVAAIALEERRGSCCARSGTISSRIGEPPPLLAASRLGFALPPGRALRGAADSARPGRTSGSVRSSIFLLCCGLSVLSLVAGVAYDAAVAAVPLLAYGAAGTVALSAGDLAASTQRPHRSGNGCLSH